MVRGADAIVIGGGLHGCSTALHLARAGLAVVLVEKDHCGRHASGVNAGGVRRLGRHVAEIPLAMASLELWQRLPELVGDDGGFHATGQLKVAENDADMEKLAARVAELRRLGFEHEELVDAATLRQWVPSIATHCPGAILCRGDGHALPFRTVNAFRRAAEAAGVAVLENHPATGLRHHAGQWLLDAGGRQFQAPRVFNCAGAWGGRVAGWIGDPVALRAEAPMLMITERVEPFLSPVLGCASRTLSFKQFDNGTLLIGGGYRGRAEPDTNTTLLDFSGLARNAATVLDLFPRLGALRVVRCWAGIEGVMPDQLPVIGASAAAEGAWHAFGFSAHGFQLGPVVGQQLAELALHGRSSIALDAFRVDRAVS